MPLALIAGAGIGGLAAGIALRRAGWDIRIFERAAAPRDIGFALGLAPNATAALRELGVGGAVAAQAVTPSSAEVRRVDGRVLRRFVAEPGDFPPGDRFQMILRPELHRALLAALGPGAVEVNRGAVRFHADHAGVSLDLVDGTSAMGDILVGADGVGSTIRGQLHPGEPPARPSGYFAVRGVSPAVERMNGLQAISYFGKGVEAAMVQAGATAIYWFVSLRAEDVRVGPVDVDSVMRRSTAGFDRQFHAVAGATPPADRRLDELLERDPLERWGAGPVTLLGDAAHPMLPHTGQGAAQALEDAVALGRAMNRGSHDPIAALRHYEAVRSRRARRVVKMGPRIARVTTTTNPAIGFLRDTAIRLIPKRAFLSALVAHRSD